MVWYGWRRPEQHKLCCAHAELGRPRIDVVCNLSGIFRDSFQNVVELLDDLFQVGAVGEAL